MTTITINVATQFSRYPSGRYRSDSRFSGQQFRDDLLVPALTSAEKVIVEMDGTLGYGSSFLDEAFGGLIRINKFAREVIHRKLIITTDNPILKIEVAGYFS